MARFNPFPRANAKYGAPMGRVGKSFIPDCEDYPKACAQCAGGDGYYDRGGAYWGSSPEEGPVWAVWVRGLGPDTVCYVRAHDKMSAIAAAFELPSGRYFMQPAKNTPGCVIAWRRNRIPHPDTRIGLFSSYTDAWFACCEDAKVNT